MRYRLWIGLCPLVLAAMPSFAQVANNTALVGTVTDTSGQAVTGAKVTAVNVATNERYSATTNEEGAYTLTFIRQGTYTITVEHAGFSRSVQEPIVVDITRRVRTDGALRMGWGFASATVNAAAT